jgi:hypothetical protein
VGSSPDPVNQFLPGIVTMFVLFAITLSARAIVEERKKGTLERLLTTRLSVGQLFLGKFLANVSRGFVQTLILLVLAYMVFQLFTPLSFIESLVIALIFAAAASALGLIIASVACSGLNRPPFRTKPAGLSEQSRPPFRRKPATPLEASDKDYGIESPLEVIHGQQEIVRAQDQRNPTFEIRLRHQ